jgi:cobalt-precorrin 5A hydrolase
LTRIAVIAITKHGIDIARKIKAQVQDVEIYAQAKHSDSNEDIHWFVEQTTKVMSELFKSFDALICIFSLGAVMRLIAPHLTDKKSDPAVLVVDDKARYVISALSGHLGGGNELARRVATTLDAEAIITTAADVNETIAVDLIGQQFGWQIDDFRNVTRVSAFMVNEESLALYQDAGQQDWWTKALPRNVQIVKNLEDIKSPEFKGALIISDRVIDVPEILDKSVVYRPKSLVVGIGLHWDTESSTIESGINSVLTTARLSIKSIRNIASINRGAKIKGLEEYASSVSIPIELYSKDQLAAISVPNPSTTVEKFEGTPSVSEAASLLSSNGELVIQKQKFPPNLTIAVSRIPFPQR